MVQEIPLRFPAGDRLATGALIGALQERVNTLRSSWRPEPCARAGDLSREHLRSELKILAEGFAL
jgi:hypothetical protein